MKEIFPHWKQRIVVQEVVKFIEYKYSTYWIYKALSFHCECTVPVLRLKKTSGNMIYTHVFHNTFLNFYS